MLSMKIESMINSLVSQLLFVEGAKEAGVGLHFHLDIRMSYFRKSERYHQSCGLHLIYHRREHSSYVSVFSGVTNSPFDKARQVSSWTHEVTHDSCWRSPNIFSQVYSDLAAKINNEISKAKRKKVAPKDMVENNSFAMFSQGAWDWIPIEVNIDPTDANQYSRILTVKK